MIARYTRSDTHSTTLYYTMSTWNPYTAVLMRTTLRTPCTATPATNCRQPTVAGASTLDLKRNADSGKDVLVWKWTKGAATDAAEFGDPVSGTINYSLCVYDSTPRLVFGATAPAQGTCGTTPCWATTATGFKYADKNRAADGLLQVKLTAGAAGRAKLLVKGKGANLPLPSLPLAQASPIAVQVQSTEGKCWEADFSAPAAKNNPAEFKDTSD